MGLISSLFQKTAKVPELKKLDLGEEQKKAVTSNLGALPGAEKLATETNRFNQEALLKALREAVPDYDQITSTISSSLASQLKGELPGDVQAAVQDKAAAKGLAGGYGGSGASRNLVARDLGLTSLDVANKALDSATRWLATSKTYLTAPQFDVSTMFVNPAQQASFDVAERNAQWNRDWLQAQKKAEGPGWLKGLGGLLDFGVGAVAGGFLGKVGGNLAGGIGSGGNDSTIDSITTPMGRTITSSWGQNANLSNPFDFEARGFYNQPNQGWDAVADYRDRV